MPVQIKSWLHAAALALLCAAFVAAGWPFLSRMGIEADEALAASGIYPRLEPVYSWHLMRHDIPVMVLSYLGALKNWICAPWLLLWGPQPAALRLPTALLGAATIVLFWRLLADVGGRWAAWTGALILATDTSFLLLTTIDFGPVALQLFLKTAALLVFVQWHKRGGLLRWAAAWFLMGLALWDKAVFVWIAAGLAAGVVAAFPRVALGVIRPRLVAIAAGSACLGALPLLSFNIVRPLETIRANASISAGSAVAKLHLLRETINGRVLFGFYTALDEPPQPGRLDNSVLRRTLVRINSAAGRPNHNWTLWAMLAVALSLPFVWRTPARAPAVFGLVSFAVGWLGMAVTAGAGAAAHHVVLLWPLHIFAIAVVLTELTRRFGRVATAAVVGVLVSVNLLVTSQYYQDLIRNGPAVRWTTALAPLCSLLRQTHARKIFIVDWGIFESVDFRTEGALPLFFADEYVRRPVPNDREGGLRVEMSAPGTVFVSHVHEYEQIPASTAAVDNFAAHAGYQKESLSIVRDQHGRAVFDIYQYRR